MRVSAVVYTAPIHSTVVQTKLLAVTGTPFDMVEAGLSFYDIYKQTSTADPNISDYSYLQQVFLFVVVVLFPWFSFFGEMFLSDQR